MWKRSMVVISGAMLAVSLPTAAFAMIAEGGGAGHFADAPAAVQATYQSTYESTLAEQVQAQVQDPVQDEVLVQSQVMDQQRLRLHVDTGPIEGAEPTQTRLRQHQQLATGNPDAPMGNSDAARGNPDAPMLGDGTGDCLYDGEPIGSGPYGQGTQSNG